MKFRARAIVITDQRVCFSLLFFSHSLCDPFYSTCAVFNPHCALLGDLFIASQPETEISSLLNKEKSRPTSSLRPLIELGIFFAQDKCCLRF